MPDQVPSFSKSTLTGDEYTTLRKKGKERLKDKVYGGFKKASKEVLNQAVKTR